MIRKVRVKGPGVKLNNKWCYIGDEAIIDEQEYEENKEYIDVIEEIEAETEIEDATEEKQNPEEEQENQNSDDGSDTNEEEESEENEDEELEALKERAKELGINVTHNMKKETIIKKIEDAEKAIGENQNPEGE